jgi:hypothetical protein
MPLSAADLFDDELCDIKHEVEQSHFPPEVTAGQSGDLL